MVLTVNAWKGCLSYIPGVLNFTRLGRAIERNLFTATYPDLFRVTLPICGEPLKKKKRLDPAIVQARFARKKRKLEKEIRKLEQNVLQFKPLEEMEVSTELLKNLQTLSRPPPNLTLDERIRRLHILKQWSRFKKQQHTQELLMFNRSLLARKKALEELRKESEDLYFEAIQLDAHLIPFRSKGPFVTPPIADYQEVDGDYKDVTKKWD